MGSKSGEKSPHVSRLMCHKFTVQILRELRRAPPRVLRIMQIISRLGRSLPHPFAGIFITHKRVTVHINLPEESICGHSLQIASLTLSLLEKHARAISHQFNRSTHRPICKPINTMPTHQQITAARERGAEADALMEDLLVAIQHHHHQQ